MLHTVVVLILAVSVACEFTQHSIDTVAGPTTVLLCVIVHDGFSLPVEAVLE
jgi:hypothetical protein